MTPHEKTFLYGFRDGRSIVGIMADSSGSRRKRLLQRFRHAGLIGFMADPATDSRASGTYGNNCAYPTWAILTDAGREALGDWQPPPEKKPYSPAEIAALRLFARPGARIGDDRQMFRVLRDRGLVNTNTLSAADDSPVILTGGVEVLARAEW